ncbi:MAG: hypothetical protein GY856_25570 [bacterium]|nr:hypothetical protein [bacterium]
MIPELLSKTPRIGLLLALLVIVLPTGGQARVRYLAFGDSITMGVGFDDCECQCEAECGYALRLQRLLRSEGIDAAVQNYGVGGERTPEGLTRLEEELEDTRGNVLLLMEGTNDISKSISPETTLFNLGEMARKAALKGLTTVHATLIPRFPQAEVDTDNVLNREIARSIRDLAFTTDRKLVDPFEVFSNTPNVFEDCYADVPTDRVGHPNPKGYDLLAGLFFDVLMDRDQVPPVVTHVWPANGAEGVPPQVEILVQIYDFGDGIDLGASKLLLNDSVVFASTTGGSHWQDLRFQSSEPLSGTVAVRVSSRDLAVPSNAMDRQVAVFTVDQTIPGPCEPNATTLCIDDEPGDNRFQVTMSWHTAQGGGQAGDATAIPLDSIGLRRGGLLSFFEISNPEMLIKVLNGCDINNKFWVFGAPTTTLGYELTVVDTLAAVRGAPRSVYEFTATNPDGTDAPTFSDVTTLDTCSYSDP